MVKIIDIPEELLP